MTPGGLDTDDFQLPVSSPNSVISFISQVARRCPCYVTFVFFAIEHCQLFVDSDFLWKINAHLKPKLQASGRSSRACHG